MSFTVKNRFNAAAIHFTLSLIVFSLFILVLLYHWFPEPYFSTTGGWQGLVIVAAVDLILGPLLTLIIFNIKKPRKELVIDLSLIAIIQISALCWGIYTMYTQRPLAVTFWEDKFYTVSAEHFPAYNIKPEILKQFGDNYPVYIYVQPAVTEEEKQFFLNKTVGEKIPPNLLPELYRPISEHFEEIFKQSIDIASMTIVNSNLNDEVRAFLKKTGTNLEENFYIPMKSGFSEIIIVFNKNGKYIGYISTPYL